MSAVLWLSVQSHEENIFSCSLILLKGQRSAAEKEKVERPRGVDLFHLVTFSMSLIRF